MQYRGYVYACTLFLSSLSGVGEQGKIAQGELQTVRKGEIFGGRQGEKGNYSGFEVSYTGAMSMGPSPKESIDQDLTYEQSTSPNREF